MIEVAVARPAVQDPVEYSDKDWKTDQDVRWCPGCGDYAILKQMQKAMAELGYPKHKTVFVSGIGCSSRFPYYMDSYGLHTIHGRAPAIATGIACQNPELLVWVMTGDGDGLSIGGNHLIHTMRRNVNLNILMFNNQIYGLTKGQYSPTSPQGQVTKSTPYGSIDAPFNPIKIALGANCSYIARSVDTDFKGQQSLYLEAAAHRGTTFTEVLQNCVIFNDGIFDKQEDKKVREDHLVRLEHGQPLVYGINQDKGIRLVDGYRLESVQLGDVSKDELLVHDEKNLSLAFLLSQLDEMEAMPTPVGIFYRVDRPCYDDAIRDQVETTLQKKGKGSITQLLHATDTWEVK